MENKILSYVDGRLKESERLEVEKHISTCATCELRVNEFRAVSGFLDELPQIALVAAEPVKQSWWAWVAPSPRVALAASMLLLATVWVGTRPAVNPATEAEINQNMPVLENYDVLTNFEPLTDLPAPVSADEPQDDAGQTNQQM
jgi:anti-sigma factor RsiW